MSNYKLRKDLSITIYDRTLFRIEATKDIFIHNVSKGDLGGYVESENNLSGNAWVYGDARVSGDARVYGNARVSGNARVYGDAWVSGDKIKNNKDFYNICCNETYNITLTTNFIKIGCQFHKKEEWFNFTDREIEAMDGLKAIHFWKKWKPILMAICECKEKETQDGER